MDISKKYSNLSLFLRYFFENLFFETKNIFSVPLRSIVTEIQEAFQFIRHRFPYTTAIHIMGHSAGAHLATMVLAQPAHDFPSLLPLTIYPISGIFDLRYFFLSINKFYNMDHHLKCVPQTSSK
jgi:hypothetical protein